MPWLFEEPTTVFSFILVAVHSNIAGVNKFFLFIFLMNILKANQQDVYPRRNSCTSVLLSFFFTSRSLLHPVVLCTRVYILLFMHKIKNDIYRILFTLVMYKYIYMAYIILFSLWRFHTTQDKHSLMHANPVCDFNRLINSLKLKILKDYSLNA